MVLEDTEGLILICDFLWYPHVEGDKHCLLSGMQRIHPSDTVPNPVAEFGTQIT